MLFIQFIIDGRPFINLHYAGAQTKSTKLMKNVMQTINENAEQIEEEEDEMIAGISSSTNKKNIQKKHDHLSSSLPVIEEKEER